MRLSIVVVFQPHARQRPAAKSARQRSLIPVIDIVPARGWAEGEAPQRIQGLCVQAFARGIDHLRWLAVLANGTVPLAADLGNVIWRAAAQDTTTFASWA